MKRVVIRSAQAPDPVGPASQALAIEARRLTSISGLLPIDPETGRMSAGSIDAQAGLVFDHLHAVLASAGLDWENLVDVTIWLADLADLPTVDHRYATFFIRRHPTRSVVGAALPDGARIQVAALAAS